MRIVIGVDPDSKASGIALYKDGDLLTLKSMPLIEIYNLFQAKKHDYKCVEIHIENVLANNRAFHKKGIKNKKASTSVNNGVGRCQQVQQEIERFAEYFEFKIVRHKISSAWKKTEQKSIFEKATGWVGRSNEDTRSAAYFGMLGVKSKPLTND